MVALPLLEPPSRRIDLVVIGSSHSAVEWSSMIGSIDGRIDARLLEEAGARGPGGTCGRRW